MKGPPLTRRNFGSLVAAGITLPSIAGAASGQSDTTGQEAKIDDRAGGTEIHTPEKSMGIYVGSDLTEDGSTILAGFGHEPSSHWLEIVPHQEHDSDATWTVGVTENADIPGELTEIPQAEETYKYISSMYSFYAGFPPPLTNGGLNEQGVAARDIWSPSRPELVEMAEAEAPQTGPQYSDLAKAAMERASTAKEAVEIVGGLMDEHGYSTYGGNSHLFADEDEGWVFINFAHPDGDLWAAERLGSDEVRVSYPGYIQEFPVEHEDDPDYMGSEKLVSFAKGQGWWDGEGDTLNLLEVYGAGQFPAEADEYFYPEFYQGARSPPDREQDLRDMSPVSLEDALVWIRDPRWSTDFQGYGQVAHIRPDTRDELQTLWTTVTSSAGTPFVPIPIATEEVPLEFEQHRYMTADAASNFLDKNWQHQEATRYATREFKRLLYLTAEHPEEFYTDVTGAIEGFEQDLLAERDEIESEAISHYESGEDQKARDLITENVRTRLLESLSLGMELADEVQATTREEFGFRRPERQEAPGETAPGTSQPMAEGGWGDMVYVYDDATHEFPREHGSFTESESTETPTTTEQEATSTETPTETDTATTETDAPGFTALTAGAGAGAAGYLLKRHVDSDD
ncbi:dipeptidase [Halodesulfurarchaeum formicicum]|uniref:Dipeptidase n=1 Tax=Halodesulfurarchaeum formicicum TaxID=1873524 RepID=A0A1D8S2I8_9EURY|nr:C69 family dipeptidase [Halodesulfurarchaeum formicicum]AOW79577.1 dipeptidase [Halodesulfurarchaeum formicicum]